MGSLVETSAFLWVQRGPDLLREVQGVILELFWEVISCGGVRRRSVFAGWNFQAAYRYGRNGVCAWLLEPGLREAPAFSGTCFLTSS